MGQNISLDPQDGDEIWEFCSQIKCDHSAELFVTTDNIAEYEYAFITFYVNIRLLMLKSMLSYE